MAIVGSAQVVIRAVTDRLQRDITQGLRNVGPQLKSAGASAGASFKNGFSQGGRFDIRQGLNQTRTDARIAGSRAGQAFGRVFNTQTLSTVRRGFQPLEAQAGGAGGRAGRAFSSGFGRSGASRTFISIGLRIAALVPILGALVGAISNVVSGLFAIASAASSAAQSLVVIPSLLGAIVQGGAVMLASFSGLGDALGAGLQAAKVKGGKAVADLAEGASDAAERVRDAARGVRDAQRGVKDAEEAAAEGIKNAIRGVNDAQRNLDDTYRDAARARKDALRQITDAEEAHRRALDDVRDAQEALNDARAEAKERIIDLRFAEEGGALAERRAIMDLQDARYELNATSELPVDNRLRQEAQLAYEEADLSLRQIRERNGDIAKEQKEVKKTGIEGMDEVQSAHEQLVSAQEAVRDAAQAVTEALRNQRQVAVDNARAIADAQRGVGEAERGVAEAREAGADGIRDANEALRDSREALRDARKAQDDANVAMAAGSTEAVKYQEELNKLSPTARHFVEYLVSLRDELTKLRDAGQRGMFPGLERSIQTVVDGLFPSLERMMFRTGKAVARASQSIANDITSGPFVGSFGRVTAQNAVTIERLGKVMGDLVRITFALLDAANPLINRFTKWFVGWGEGTRKLIQGKNATGELTKTFDRAGDRMVVIIDIVKNLAEGFFDLGKIGDNQGMRLLRVFRRTTEEFANFTDNPDNRKMLRRFFRDTADNFVKISRLVKIVGGAFLRLGADPAIGKLATALEPVILNIERLITTMLDESGTEIVEFVDSIVKAFAELSEGGGLDTFLGVLTGFFKGLTALMGAPVIGDGLKLLISVGAAMYAISIIRKFPGISMLDKGLTGIAKGFGKSKFGKTIATNLRFAGAAAWHAGKQMVVAAARGTKGLVIQAAQIVKTNALWALMVAKQKAIAAGQVIMAGAMRLVTGVMKGMRIAATLMFGPWGIAIAAVAGLFILLYKKVDWFRAGVDKAVDFIQKGWDKLVEGATWLYDKLVGHSIFPDLLKAMSKIFRAIGRVIHFVVKLVIGYVKLWIKFFQNVLAPVVKWLFNRIIRPIFNAIGRVISFVWKSIIKPVFTALWKFIKTVLIPIIQFYWFRVIKPIFGFIGRLIKATWDNFIKPALKALWNFIRDTIIPIVKRLWQDIIRPMFNAIGDKIRDTWRRFISPAFNAIRDFIRDKLIPAFTSAKEGIVKMWDKIKESAKAPVRFVIDTIYNDGLRLALNKIPGVDLGKATVPFARGGVLPGYSPGRDIHKFYSPTAGMNLHLSGGEAIMRPEFTRAVGGPAGVERLNSLARKGKFSGRAITDQMHARGGVVYIDGEPMSSVAARQLALAEHLYMPMHVMQGSYQPYTDYSGSSHMGGGVMDTGPGSFSAQYALRRVGFAAWVRNVPGAAYAGSGAHVHSVSRLDPAAAGHAQLSSWARGEDGLGGPDYGPRPALLPNLSKLLGGISISAALAAGGGISAHDAALAKGKEKKSNWLDIAGDIKDIIGNVTGAINTMKERVASNEWYKIMAAAATSSAHDAVQYFNDKIPNEISIPGPNIPLPDNPIPNPFDGGGLARGEGWMPKNVVAPERMLSPRQTVAFERLVDILDRRGAPGGGIGIEHLEVKVPHDASPREVVDGIMYELHRMNQGGRYTR